VAKKQNRNQDNKKGPEGFESHYSEIYQDRWPVLKAALLAPTKKVARVNPFADREQIKRRAQELRKLQFADVEAFELTPEVRFEPEPDRSGIYDYYLMDPSSIFAALLCSVKEGMEVLDLCAAPGGKSLLLAERIGSEGSLTCNELSPQRRARLRAVLEDYLPKERLNQVRVTGFDGSRWCLHETEAFDRILVDAPCSGERHLLANAAELAQWSQARSKNLAVRQYSLLASALAVVRRGGRVVYSTCSISPLEDDSVIARLMKKRAGEVRVVDEKPSGFEFAEKTEFGWMILPDRSGYGPLYAAALERI